MPANVSIEYTYAEKKYLQAQTDEEKLAALEEMLSQAPSHKGGESLRADLKLRIKKLKEKIQNKKKQKKQTKGKEGIRKEGVQVVLIGLTQSGKSSLLFTLTNAKPEISSHQYTTKEPLIGMSNCEGINFQILDMPAVNYEAFDQGLANNADILLITITRINELEIVMPFLEKAIGKKIIAFNKSDLLSQEEKRKIEATLKSKKYNFAMISAKTSEGITELKKKLIENSGVIRIYTKQPCKPTDKDPVIMHPNSTIKDVAEKILHGFSARVKEARVTGPSSKFPNQKVGFSHLLRDRDIVEFKTD